MAVINLKDIELYSEEEADGSIDYQGHGVAFLKKDLSEKLLYCDDLEREEVEAFFINHVEYYFGTCSLEWTLESKPPMGRGKIAMWFAKYWKNGYYEEPFV
jgi:hypothetical protein